MNTYEMKREILNFSKKISEGLNKCTSKFVMDMEYGLAKSKSVLLSNWCQDRYIAKPYGKKFEDLDKVVDASSLNKEAVNGYHVCEAVILTEKEKQPISVYSEIYSNDTIN